MMVEIAYTNTPTAYSCLAQVLVCLLYLGLNTYQRPEIKRWISIGILTVIHILYYVFGLYIYQILGKGFMVGVICIMYGYFYFGTGLSLKKRWYYLIRAFLLSECMAATGWLVYCFLSNYVHISQIGQYIILLAGYVLTICIVWLLERKMALENERIHISRVALAASLIIGVSLYIFSGLAIDYAVEELQGHYALALFAVRSFIDLAGVLMLYSHNIMLYNMQIKNENYVIQTLLAQQKSQYQLSKQSIDLVNMKYHDLKHQLNVLKQLQGADVKHYIDHLEGELEYMEQRIECGNKILDVILTEENMKCFAKGIEMSVMVDGKELDFLSLEDLCTIFGNAIDNAIEHLESLKDVEKEKKQIFVRAYRAHNFVIISFENFCGTELNLQGGLPASTKGDTRYHGFGTKSIQYVVEQKEGKMEIRQEDGWFKLKIIMSAPIAE